MWYIHFTCKLFLFLGLTVKILKLLVADFCLVFFLAFLHVFFFRLCIFWLPLCITVLLSSEVLIIQHFKLNRDRLVILSEAGYFYIKIVNLLNREESMDFKKQPQDRRICCCG